jgi:hypothetical protein
VSSRHSPVFFYKKALLAVRLKRQGGRKNKKKTFGFFMPGSFAFKKAHKKQA